MILYDSICISQEKTQFASLDFMNVADEKTSQTWIRLHCRGLSSFDSGVVARDDGKSMGNFRHQLVGGFNHLEKYYGYSNLEIMVIQIFVV